MFVGIYNYIYIYIYTKKNKQLYTYIIHIHVIYIYIHINKRMYIYIYAHNRFGLVISCDCHHCFLFFALAFVMHTTPMFHGQVCF